ncbi:hypothetical protein Droror1_Dr00002742 [Drosera rotundifolia]
MEQISEGVNNLSIADPSSKKNNRIQVSNTKRPLFFYINLAKRYLQQHNEVELSALGMGIATSTIDIGEPGGRPILKAKIEIVLGKSDNFDDLIAASAIEVEDGEGPD